MEGTLVPVCVPANRHEPIAVKRKKAFRSWGSIYMLSVPISVPAERDGCKEEEGVQMLVVNLYAVGTYICTC